MNKVLNDSLICDLEKIRMPEIYNNIISYMFDILYMDGASFGYELKKFKITKVYKNIVIFVDIRVYNAKIETRTFCITIKPKDLFQYDVLIINAKTKTCWKLNNLRTLNYINSIGLLLHPERLVNSKNVQYA